MEDKVDDSIQVTPEKVETERIVYVDLDRNVVDRIVSIYDEGQEDQAMKKKIVRQIERDLNCIVVCVHDCTISRDDALRLLRNLAGTFVLSYTLGDTRVVLQAENRRKIIKFVEDNFYTMDDIAIVEIVPQSGWRLRFA